MSPPGAEWWQLPRPSSTTAPGRFPSNETICMLMVSCSCYHPQSPMSYSEVRGCNEFKSITLILLTLFCFGKWCLRAITIQIFGDIFICESSPEYCNVANNLSVFFLIHLLLFFKWVINGSIHKKPIQDIPTELVQNFPRCFCCSSVFCLEWCQALPSLSQDSLSKAAPYAVPCSHYSQTRTAAHLGDTNTHLHIVEAPTITCSLIGSAEVSLVTLLKQNTDAGGERNKESTSDFNLC